MAMSAPRFFNVFRILPLCARLIAQALIGAYRLILSPLVGLDCRHLPTCSAYAGEAIGRFGLWAGGWMTFARLCRCHPLGTSGLDFVPASLPRHSRWYLPWRYGLWRGTNPEPGLEPPLRAPTHDG
jgi:putative membrane protein insertion efficiency factor